MADFDTPRTSQSFTGLSGTLPFDANEVIGKLVEAQRRPIEKVERQQASLESQRTLLEEVVDKLNGLRDVAKVMQSPQRLLPMAAESASPTAVKASAGEGAHAGVLTIEVTSLAAAERRLSRSLSAEESDDLHLPASTFRWKQNGEEHGVDIAAGSSLKAVANAINRAREGLEAGVIFDGRSYRLSVRASSTGLDSALDIVDDLGLGLQDASSVVQAASDADFVIDDVLHMSRPQNIVSDAVDGLTLRLESITDRTNISVAVDAATMLERVATFVDAYNSVRQAVDSASKPTKEVDRDRLVGDATMRTLVDSLQRTITAAVPGAAADLPSLSSIGITSDRDGLLTVDTAKLIAIGTDRPEDVARLFSRDHKLMSRGVASSALTVAEQYGAPLTGSISLKLASMRKQKHASDARMMEMETSVERYEQATRQKFTELERTMTMMKSQNEKLQQQIKSMQRRD